MIVFVLYCFHFCAEPDNPRQHQTLREQLQLTAVVAETNLHTRVDSEAKVNLFGLSGLHSQNEKPNPTYIRVGALLHSRSESRLKQQ